MLGLDGDGPEVFEAVERFVRESGQFDVQITVMTAFPGTPLYERLKAEGRLLIVEGAWEQCTLFDVNFRPCGCRPRHSSTRRSSSGVGCTPTRSALRAVNDSTISDVASCGARSAMRCSA